jgi:hypothetical protein
MPGIRVRRRAARGVVVAVAALGLVGGSLMGGSLMGGGTGPAAAAPPPAPAPVTPAGVVAGYDISWPHCTPAQGGFGNPMPDASAKFVVIGLSNGRAFTTNPCLGDQLTFARSRHLLTSAYVFPTYPTNAEYATYGKKGPYPTSTAKGRLRNVGWAQAAYWTATAKRVGFRTPMIWVDVEKREKYHTWTNRPQDRNLPVIQGLVAGLRHYGYRTGIYTPSAHWKEITGGVRLGLPEWTANGPTGASTALATCGKPGNQGSPVLMGQYTNATRTIDYDVLCPIMNNRAYRLRWFRQY